MHTNYLRMFKKCRFLFCRSGRRLKFCIFNWQQDDDNDADLYTTLGVVKSYSMLKIRGVLGKLDSQGLVAQSCPTLCNLMDCSLPGSSVPGIPDQGVESSISQARILEWVAISSSGGPSWPRDRTSISCLSCIAGGFFTAEPLGKPRKTGQLSVKEWN